MQLNMGNKFWSQLITYEGLQHVAFKALHIRHPAIIQVEVFWRSLVVGYPNIVNVISYLYDRFLSHFFRKFDKFLDIPEIAHKNNSLIMCLTKNLKGISIISVSHWWH